MSGPSFTATPADTDEEHPDVISVKNDLELVKTKFQTKLDLHTR